MNETSFRLVRRLSRSDFVGPWVQYTHRYVLESPPPFYGCCLCSPVPVRLGVLTLDDILDTRKVELFLEVLRSDVSKQTLCLTMLRTAPRPRGSSSHAMRHCSRLWPNPAMTFEPCAMLGHRNPTLCVFDYQLIHACWFHAHFSWTSRLVSVLSPNQGETSLYLKSVKLCFYLGN